MLDPRSLMFELALMLALLAMVACGLRSLVPRSIQGPGLWALALVAYALAALALAIPQQQPGNAILLAANLGLIVATCTAGVGLRALLQHPADIRWRVPIAVAVYAILVLTITAASLPVLRVALGLLYVSLTFMDACWVIARSCKLRREAGSRVLGAGLLLTAMAALYQTAAAITGWFGPADQMAGAVGPNVSFILGCTAGLTLISFGVLLVVAQRMHAHVAFLATHDPLTGVLNRNGFRAVAEHVILGAKRSEAPVAFAIIDVDWFKRINDQYGHAAGDAVLRGIARVARAQLRATDLISRFGGEEFAVLFPNCPESVAERCCERVRIAIESSPIAFEGQQISVNVSIGVCAMPGSSADHEAMYRCADAALYAAKRDGRNRVVLTKPAATTRLLDAATLPGLDAESLP